MQHVGVSSVRVLLMINNNNMALRELYSAMLDNHPAGFITSFMSGMPDGVGAIVAGYDAVIYELGPADTPERVSAATSLAKAGVPVVTHVEGRAAAQRVQELRQAGVLVVESPLNGQHIGEILDTLDARVRKQQHDNRPSLGSRFRRIFGG